MLLETGGLRLLTDPTFDPEGSEYATPLYTLRKTQGPALSPEALGEVDAVLLSHDHHFDNLDRAGRAFLARAKAVLTTPAGAERLGPPSVGLAPWQEFDLEAGDGRQLRVTATPARHGPATRDRGPVTGFALAWGDGSEGGVYVSGDTVWYEGIAEVARRVRPSVAFLFMGAARVREVGPDHLTFTAEEGVEAAHAFRGARIVPVHYEGWAHFTEGRGEIERAFDAAGLAGRTRWLPPGQAAELPRAGAASP